MKKSSIIFITLCVIGCICLTSCLKDDERNGTDQLSNEERVSYFLSMTGTYTGSVTYTDDDDTKQTIDNITAVVSGNGSDSIIVAKAFPNEVIAACIQDSTKIKEALLKTENKDINSVFHFNAIGSVISYKVISESMDFDINYDGKVHKVNILFSSNPPSSGFGIFNASKHQIGFKLEINAIYVDNKTVPLRKIHSFAFEGEKAGM